MNVEWKFAVRVENPILGSRSQAYGSAIGLNMSCHEDVYQIAKELEYQVKEANKTEGRWYAWIDVSEHPDSPRLTRLLQILEERYGYKPWPHAVFDMRQRDRFFGVQKIRTFSRKEIGQCEFLAFGLTHSLGHAVFRTEEQFAEDQYVADKVANLKKDPAMGVGTNTRMQIASTCRCTEHLIHDRTQGLASVVKQAAIPQASSTS